MKVVLLRMNRKYSAEGSFAQLKHDMNFKKVYVPWTN